MSDCRQFLFICYVTDKLKGEALNDHLNSLVFPPGYSAAKDFLEGELCCAQAYNIAMRHAAAKYKVYLNQNTKIENPLFLSEILSLFQKYPDLGVLGVVGAKRLPLNGNWREAQERYGKVLYSGELVQYREISNDYETVQVVDGLLMATQYDLPWREDLFLGEFLFDSAQCLEFIKSGYRVGIAKQHEPWCSYDAANDGLVQYYRERDLFINEYARFLGLPLSV